jgi:putative flippase GtrA
MMSATLRWGRFNIVGLLGCAVQLALLALLTRLTTLPVTVCVALAVLVTVSHNFVWHIHYTWPATHRTQSLARRWLAFNLSNGAISLACNLLVTTTVSAATGLPVTLANLLAIGLASIANFAISDRLVFR